MNWDDDLLRVVKHERPGNIVTAPPVVAEIEFGLCRFEPGSKKRLLLESEKKRILSVISVLTWSPDASSLFGRIKADLEKRGKLIEDFDIAIAAIAISHDYALITRNPGHFNRIAGLQVIGW